MRMVVGMAVVFGLAGVVFPVGLWSVVEFAGGCVILQLFLVPHSDVSVVELLRVLQ